MIDDETIKVEGFRGEFNSYGFSPADAVKIGFFGEMSLLIGAHTGCTSSSAETLSASSSSKPIMATWSMDETADTSK
jgi:hypothetical protein